MLVYKATHQLMLQQRLPMVLQYLQCLFHIVIPNKLFIHILNRFIYQIQTVIGYTPLSGVYCRHDESVLWRCRIGHSHITHAYLLKGEDKPKCIACNEDLTVKHILIDCVDFSYRRQNVYTSKSLKHLFTQVAGHFVLVSFLREINLKGQC